MCSHHCKELPSSSSALQEQAPQYVVQYTSNTGFLQRAACKSRNSRNHPGRSEELCFILALGSWQSHGIHFSGSSNIPSIDFLSFGWRQREGPGSSEEHIPHSSLDVSGTFLHCGATYLLPGLYVTPLHLVYSHGISSWGLYKDALFPRQPGSQYVLIFGNFLLLFAFIRKQVRRRAPSKRSVFSCKPEKLFGDENTTEKRCFISHQLKQEVYSSLELFFLYAQSSLESSESCA